MSELAGRLLILVVGVMGVLLAPTLADVGEIGAAIVSGGIGAVALGYLAVPCERKHK